MSNWAMGEGGDNFLCLGNENHEEYTILVFSFSSSLELEKIKKM